MVLICELLKLVMSSLFYFKEWVESSLRCLNVDIIFSHNIASMVASMSGDIKVMGLYLVPALLYCVSNNVFFLSISYFNPTTYAMFLQIRLLLTGVIYQVKTWTYSTNWILQNISDSLQNFPDWQAVALPPCSYSGLYGSCCRQSVYYAKLFWSKLRHSPIFQEGVELFLVRVKRGRRVPCSWLLAVYLF